MNDCLICEIVAGDLPVPVLQSWHDAVLIEPLDPIGPGHRLLVPRQHVVSAGENPAVTAAAMRRAIEVAGSTGDVKILPSHSQDSGCPVGHLRLEITPRTTGRPPATPPPSQWTVEDKMTAIQAATAVLTEPGIPGAIGTIAQCGPAVALARFLAIAGRRTDAVMLLMTHGLYDDADQEHYDLTIEQAEALLSDLPK